MQDYGFDRFESRVPWNQTKWDPDVLLSLIHISEPTRH